MKPRPAEALLPETPLPSGWAIEPVSGHCIRLSDGAEFGRATSHAIAWSMSDVAVQLAKPTGLALELARLRNAVGCAFTGATFSGDESSRRRAADAVHAAGQQLRGGATGPWQWQSDAAACAAFNQRLARLLDTVGVADGRCPAANAPAVESQLLTGCIGRIAVRSVLRFDRAGAPAAPLVLHAQDAGDASGALQRARAWAVEAARQCLPQSAEAALALVCRIPFHEDDVACVDVIHAARRALARAV